MTLTLLLRSPGSYNSTKKPCLHTIFWTNGQILTKLRHIHKFQGHFKVSAGTYRPQRENTCLQCRLINAFVIHFLESTIYKLATSKISGGFCPIEAHVFSWKLHLVRMAPASAVYTLLFHLLLHNPSVNIFKLLSQFQMETTLYLGWENKSPGHIITMIAPMHIYGKN